MKEYHKIQTLFLRDPETKFKTLLIGEYAHHAFEYLRYNNWIFTEKVDGTNIRVMLPDYHDDKRFGITFGGKTDEAQIPASLVKRLEERFHSDEMRAKLAEMFPKGNVCLYGEGYGAKIQKGGGNYRADQDFVLFDVRVGEWWLERPNIEDIAKQLNLDIVPVIGSGTLGDMAGMVASGFKSTWGDFLAEGLVARPACELVTRNGDRIITKLKHKDFQPTARPNRD